MSIMELIKIARYGVNGYAADKRIAISLHPLTPCPHSRYPISLFRTIRPISGAKHHHGIAGPRSTPAVHYDGQHPWELHETHRFSEDKTVILSASVCRGMVNMLSRFTTAGAWQMAPR